jgi:hypothetical protein
MLTLTLSDTEPPNSVAFWEAISPNFRAFSPAVVAILLAAKENMLHPFVSDDKAWSKTSLFDPLLRGGSTVFPNPLYFPPSIKVRFKK